MEGNISVEEFYKALEAYSCTGEKHYATDGSDYYVSFEHKAMFKLLQILKDRNIRRWCRVCGAQWDVDVLVADQLGD